MKIKKLYHQIKDNVKLDNQENFISTFGYNTIQMQ